MSTMEFLEKLFAIIDEVLGTILMLVGVWLATQVRKWLRGELPVPPYEHHVTLQEPTRR